MKYIPSIELPDDFENFLDFYRYLKEKRPDFLGITHIEITVKKNGIPFYAIYDINFIKSKAFDVIDKVLPTKQEAILMQRILWDNHPFSQKKQVQQTFLSRFVDICGNN